jgi:hypothetical protein
MQQRGGHDLVAEARVRGALGGLRGVHHLADRLANVIARALPLEQTQDARSCSVRPRARGR